MSVFHSSERAHQQWVRRKTLSVHCVVAAHRDLCVRLGAVLLTGDFNKGAERDLPPSGTDSQRRLSPLEAAFGHTPVPWPATVVNPWWGPGAEPEGKKWPECCGFGKMPGSQDKWLIMRHGSFELQPASTGWKASDKTWHYEQWLHLKFASRQRRKNGSPSGMKSRQHK